MCRILMYHNFSGPGARDADALNVEGIRRQFEYLRRYFHVVPLLHLVEQLAGGRDLEKRSVVLTIDDGHRNCYEFLFPLLKEFELPATLFVVSSFIRGEDWIWTDKVLWLSDQPNCPEVLRPEQLASAFRWLNRMSPDERNAVMQALADQAGVCIPKSPPAKYAPCSWSELREMADSGLLEVGSHTVTHPILSTISDEASWDELTRSRAHIEEGMGRKISCFCFPNGMPGDYRESQVRQVEETGYACSVVAQSGLVRARSDRYRLPRIGVARKSSTEEFSRWLDGGMHYKEKLASWFRPQNPD
jgi:peptidoglycan/xylan/chitin deacetylase (PgdA/CDA1 family)